MEPITIATIIGFIFGAVIGWIISEFTFTLTHDSFKQSEHYEVNTVKGLPYIKPKSNKEVQSIDKIDFRGLNLFDD